MLRAEIQAGTELGNAARSIMASGGLVSDDLVNKMLARRVAQPDCQRGFLLDGYPRTLQQAEFFDALVKERGLPKPIILHLDVPMDALIGCADLAPPMSQVRTDLQPAPPATQEIRILR